MKFVDQNVFPVARWCSVEVIPAKANVVRKEGHVNSTDPKAGRKNKLNEPAKENSSSQPNVPTFKLMNTGLR
jgi:hypothetical protein